MVTRLVTSSAKNTHTEILSTSLPSNLGEQLPHDTALVETKLPTVESGMDPERVGLEEGCSRGEVTNEIIHNM